MNPEKFVIQFLKSFGFNPKKVEESDSKTPDFIIKADDGIYLIEQKTKFDDTSKRREKNKILQDGLVYDENTSINHQKTVAKRIRKASKQLTTPEFSVDYRIVWLLALGADSYVQMKQFEMTLFGSANLFDLNDESNTMKSCYYFGESSFFKYNDRIDAAVISSLDRYALCVNNYSPRYNSFKESSFCNAFKDGVIDPIVLEANNRAYIVNGDINRCDKKEVLKHVQKKYNKPRLIDLNFNSYSASVLVPDR